MRYTKITALAAVILSAGLATAQEASKGETLYVEHCATCHGLDLDGLGPMSGVMIIKPSDLTALTAKHEGVFPVERVVKRIDGRDPLVAHGSPMPVYGHFFEGGAGALKTDSGQPIITSRAIVELVNYIESKQQ